MNEKRFFTKINKNGRNVIIDKECHIEIIDLTLACEVLNRLDLKLKHYNEVNGEQQATIESEMDLFEKYKASAIRDMRDYSDKIIEMQKKVDEQQDTIRKLRNENIILKNKIEDLRVSLFMQDQVLQRQMQKSDLDE